LFSDGDDEQKTIDCLTQAISSFYANDIKLSQADTCQIRAK